MNRLVGLVAVAGWVWLVWVVEQHRKAYNALHRRRR